MTCFYVLQTSKTSHWAENKRPMHGPHRSLDKQFQSINTLAQSNDYAILHEKKTSSPFWELNGRLFWKTWALLIISNKDTLRQVWLKLVQWFCRRQFFKFCQYIIAISWCSPLDKRSGPLFEQSWILFTQECFVWLKLAQRFWWRSLDFFKFNQCCLLFHYNLPLRKGVALHLNKVESSSPKNALWQVQFGAGIF